jgi:hypothetical protein
VFYVSLGHWFLPGFANELDHRAIVIRGYRRYFYLSIHEAVYQFTAG